MNIIKLPILSAYYFIYLTMEKWVNPILIITAVAAGILGWYTFGKKQAPKLKRGGIVIKIAVLLYFGILISTYKDVVDKGFWGYILRFIYFIGVWILAFGVGEKLHKEMTCSEKSYTLDKSSWRNLNKGVFAAYIIGMIPLFFLSPYIFPKADDYSFGYHAHRAWEATGSLIEVAKAAVVMVKEAYFDWQGTYTSIFLMAVQPAVFDEKFYAVVPFLFIALITISSWFFLKTLLVNVLQGDKVLSQVCIWSYILFVVQRVPDSQSAFIWYNGATHYIISHCMLLFMLAFIIRLWLGKRQWSNCLGAVISGIYVGGGNQVTAVGTLLICLTILCVVTWKKSWKKHKAVIFSCVVYFGALIINFMAPGNFNRMGRQEGYGLFASFFLAFIKSMEYMFGKWMHWSVLLLVLFLLPVFWKVVRKTKITFSYPLLVIGYSWCYMASLFFAPLFTIKDVTVGRFQNVMYMQWILILLFDIAYVLGWLQRKYELQNVSSIVQNEKKYILCVLGSFLIFMGLSAAGEPQKYTATYALQTLMDSGLQQYREEYWEMVDILNSDAKEVEITDFSYIPEYLDVSLRHEGLCLFYSKDKVIIKQP